MTKAKITERQIMTYISQTLRLVIALVMLVVAAQAAAHKYYFAITDINYSDEQRTIEIVHQFTAHDIENAIAEQQNITFNSGHPEYDNKVRAYVESHFQLFRAEKQLPLTWLGLEIDRDKIVVYQQADNENFLSGLLVKNDLLVDTYAKQVSTVNYRDKQVFGSLTFTESQRIGRITDKN